MADKNLIKANTQALLGLTGRFCDERLDAEYKQLSENLIRKMSRKREVPFVRGRLEIWAAAVIYALGQVNFLFDKSFEPYVSADDIADYFGVSKSTVSQKAQKIRQMFKLSYLGDDEFLTQHIRDTNPLRNMIMIDGLIFDVHDLPPEFQEILQLGAPAESDSQEAKP